MATYVWEDGWSVVELCSLIGLILGGFGVITNLVMLRVASLTNMSHLSVSLFLSALALTDTAVLVFHMLEDLGNLMVDTSASDLLYGDSDWRCRISNFVYDWTFMLSSWCMVGAVAELFLVQMFPSRRSTLQSSRRALYVVSSMMLIALAGCFPISVITLAVSHGECSSDYQKFYDIYHNVVIKLLINGVVPIFIILVSLGKCGVSLLFAKTDGVVTEVNDEDNTIKIQDVAEPKEPPSRLSNTVVAIGIVFVASMTPYSALTSITTMQRHNIIDYEPPYDMQHALAIGRLILHTNYSLKFLMAFLFSRTFRTAFRQVCNYGSTSHSPSMNAIGRPINMNHNRTTRTELYSTDGQPGVAPVQNGTAI